MNAAKGFTVDCRKQVCKKSVRIASEQRDLELRCVTHYNISGETTLYRDFSQVLMSICTEKSSKIALAHQRKRGLRKLHGKRRCNVVNFEIDILENVTERKLTVALRLYN